MAKAKVDRLDLKAIRTELGLTQSELAAYLGISVRTVQSCEQGWRCPGAAVHKPLLLLLITHRRGSKLKNFRCWEAKQCAQEHRENCLIYISGQGHLCWFLTGNLCTQRLFRRWEDRLAMCNTCDFFLALMQEKTNPGPVAGRQSP